MIFQIKSMSAVKDGYVFDIRKLQTFNDGKTLRLSISHNVEPLIGSKWTVGNADRRTCWNSKPKDGGRRVAVFPSSDMLVQLFNEVSTEVSPLFFTHLSLSVPLSLPVNRERLSCSHLVSFCIYHILSSFSSFSV